MCQECGFITGHANTCPNNPDIYEPILTDCVLCGREVDEIETTYGICEKCWTDAHAFDNAIKYGETATDFVRVNGLFAKVLTTDQINEALLATIMRVKESFPDYADRYARIFLRDDDGDFADWLKEQKGNG